MSEYPGLGLDLRYHGQIDRGHKEPGYPLGMHTNCEGSKSELLLVREVAMMMVMDILTDKPGWHRKLFDDEIARKWTEEALAIPASRFHNEIVKRSHDPDSPYEPFDPKPLKTILDKGCLEYVCPDILLVFSVCFISTDLIITVHSRAPLQG